MATHREKGSVTARLRAHAEVSPPSQRSSALFGP
jgi:hypothetical protein